MTTQQLKVLIKGAGEVASGIAHEAYRAGYLVYMTEIPAPLAVSRATCFSDAIFDGSITIEGVTAVLTPLSASKIDAMWQEGKIPVLVDPDAVVINLLPPDVLVDARMLKKAADTRISDAALVIGIGPGFYAGRDVHVLIESNDRTGNMGKLIFQGESEANTGEPIPVGGLTSQRVIWAPVDGTFKSDFKIGDAVSAGQAVGSIDGNEIKAPLGGHLRGLIRSGVAVTRGVKLLEVDHLNAPEEFFRIRPKMVVLGKAVIQAINERKAHV